MTKILSKTKSTMKGLTIEDVGGNTRTFEVVDSYLYRGKILVVVFAYGFNVAYELFKSRTVKFRGYVGQNGSSRHLLEKAEKFSVEKLMSKIENLTFSLDTR